MLRRMRFNRFVVLGLSLVFVACTPTPPAPPVRDSGMIDAAHVRDTGTPDTGPDDTGPPDTGAPDTGPPDTGVDASGCDRRADCDTTAGCETQLGTTTNCMTCGDRCTAPTAATATCDFDLGCDWACNAGYENCDTVDGNGCEINTDTDTMHCGDCSTVCRGYGVNVRVGCAGGDCVLSCQSGFGDCNGDLLTGAASDGCEQGLSTLTDCGTCGMPCTLAATALNASPSCSTGTCRMNCATGYRDCNGMANDGCELMGTSCP